LSPDGQQRGRLQLDLGTIFLETGRLEQAHAMLEAAYDTVGVELGAAGDGKPLIANAYDELI